MPVPFLIRASTVLVLIRIAPPIRTASTLPFAIKSRRVLSAIPSGLAASLTEISESSRSMTRTTLRPISHIIPEEDMRHPAFQWELLRWGERVTVRRLQFSSSGAEYLLIETDAPNPDEPVPAEAAASRRSAVNLLPILLDDAVNLGNVERSTPEPHLQFANAVDDDKLLKFIEYYGPVFSAGDRPDEGGPTTIPVKVTALENLNELRNERSRFASLLHLIGVLKEPVLNRVAVQVAAKEVIKGYEPRKAPIDIAYSLSRGCANRSSEALLYEDLLRFLREFQFSPQVVFRGPKARPGIAVLPERSGRGFRHILYGLLLRELQGETLPPRVCAYAACGKSFRPDRVNQTCCGKKCSWKKASKKHYYGRGGPRKRELRESRLRGTEIVSKSRSRLH